MNIDDLNADGMLDLVVADYGIDSYESWVWLGYSEGGFWLFFSATIPGVEGSIGDFTGDGILDLVTAGQTVEVMPGLGDGTFAAPLSHPGNGFDARSVEVADFNGDGKLDVITASPLAGSVSVLLGRGDGTLAPPIDHAAGESAALAVGDFNADGRPDVAAADASTDAIRVLLNDGDWTSPPVPVVRIGDATVTEGNTGSRTATFTVTLSTASSQTVTVAYASGNGTATAGSDFQAASGTLTFAPGETSKTITVLVNGDRLAEPNESFVVNLSGSTNAIIADGQGVGTIFDDEPRISIGDVTKAEGKKNQTTLFTFTVTLSAAYDQAVTMSFRTENGTAKSGEDYVARTGTLAFAPGETTKTITIEVKGDYKREANEYFYLDLFGNSGNSLFAKSRGTGTILNDD